eukprot:COSAG03_NODE_669_length_6368_cov_57.753390_1_plen_328_part_10
MCVNALRRDFTVGFAVVVRGRETESERQSERGRDLAALSPTVELLQQALYTVIPADDLASGLEQLRSSCGGGATRGLLVVQHGCSGDADGSGEFEELVALSAAGKLAEGVAVVAVLPEGSAAGVALRERARSARIRLEVLAEPVQAAEVAQLCWLLPPPEVRLPPGVPHSGGAPLVRQLSASKVTGEWKDGLGSAQQLRDKLTKPLQRAVGGKKTRFVDRENSLDLNLCYITKTCIAMGLPAGPSVCLSVCLPLCLPASLALSLWSGLSLCLCFHCVHCVRADATEGLIRNNIKEVARFFELRHPDGPSLSLSHCLSLCLAVSLSLSL